VVVIEAGVDRGQTLFWRHEQPRNPVTAELAQRKINIANGRTGLYTSERAVGNFHTLLWLKTLHPVKLCFVVLY
jgi:hypothetical protein